MIVLKRDRSIDDDYSAGDDDSYYVDNF